MSETVDWDVRLAGDDAVCVRASDVSNLRQLGRQLRLEGDWEEVVDGIEDLTILFDPLHHSPSDVLNRLRQTELMEHGDQKEAAIRELRVSFGSDDGPDLEKVCETLGMSQTALIDRLTKAELFVDMLGFTPGFAYIGGVPDELNVPRLSEPRQRVPAGSLGLAAGKCGTYSLDGPGGWPIIGRVQSKLFDPSSDSPFLLEPGMKIRLFEDDAF